MMMSQGRRETGTRAAHFRRRLRAVAGLLLGSLLLLGAGTSPAHAYLWEEANPQENPVALLRVEIVGYPLVARLAWSHTPFGGAGNALYTVQRRVEGSGTWTNLGSTSTQQYWEDTSLAVNTAYEYRVLASGDAEPTMMLPAPPPCANEEDIYRPSVNPGTQWKTIRATVKEVLAADNVTADSRLDLRYGNPTFLDFNFGTRTYRGGLFVGYAPDPSRVGRSYLKFTLPSLPMGETVWTATLNAYHLRNLADGTVTVGAQAIGTSWTTANLKWSTAPAFNNGSPEAQVACAWNSMSPTSSWKRWDVTNAIGTALVGSGTAALGLASLNEGTHGWAYFAKKEYDPNLAPRVLYAYGSPLEPLSLTFNPNPGTGGHTTTATLELTAAPMASMVFTLSSSDTNVATVPSTVTVPAGSKRVTFTVTLAQVQCPQSVTIGATNSGNGASGVLEVQPGGFCCCM